MTHCAGHIAFRVIAALTVLFSALEYVHADKPTGALLSSVRQLTFEGRRSGEGYFNATGDRIVFQSEREPGNPFFQIYCLDLSSGDTNQISNGRGKTTCAWIHPSNDRALFASTHDDPDAAQKQRSELAFRASGKSKRYSWDFDQHFDIYESSMTGAPYRKLTDIIGYDAEGSYSPDGNWIAFASNRHAYSQELSPSDRDRLNTDASYFLEIYIMRSDGSDVRRLTRTPGYDGGPFFSPEGKKICWRRFSPDGSTAEIWTMNLDGSDARQITRLGVMSWAPYFHPSGDYLIFTTNLHGFSNFELYLVDSRGRREPVRVTDQAKFDGLPVFHPDGKRLAWTSNRTADATSQIFIADFDDALARRLLKLDHESDDTDASPDTLRATEKLSPEVLASDLAILAASLKNGAQQTADSGARCTVESIAEKIGLVRREIPSGGAPIGCCQSLGMLPGSNDSNDTAILVVGSVVSDSIQNSIAASYLLEIAHFVSAKTNHSTRRRSIHFLTHEPDCGGSCFSGVGKIQAVVELLITDKPQRTIGVWAAGSSNRWRSEIERRNVPVGAALTMHPEANPKGIGAMLTSRMVPTLQIEGCTLSNERWFDRAEQVAKLSALISKSIVVSTDPPAFEATENKPKSASRPYLGTEPDYRGSNKIGVLINKVTPNGPADLSGMKSGDVLTAIDGKSVANVSAYAEVLDTLRAGQTIEVSVKRGSQQRTLTIVVGERQ